jgi:DNA-directed RNA polymerase specialized sigma24 family protein
MDFSSENDADLLWYMAQREADAEGARDAGDEFARRHRAFLQRRCRLAYADLLGNDRDVEDLVQSTLLRAFERASRFSRRGAVTVEEITGRVRGWLLRIATRVFQDVARGRDPPMVEIVDDGAVEDTSESADTPTGLPPDDLRRVAEAWERLTSNEQEVLRLTLQWYDPGREHQRLPSGVAEDLARRLETTPENLRQIRRRGLRKIEELLAAEATTVRAAGGRP